MGAQIQDFYRGDTKKYKFTITADGVPVNVSTDTYWCTLKVNKTDADNASTTEQIEKKCASGAETGDDFANGVVVITIPSTTTGALTAGDKYYIDFQRRTTDGEVTTMLVDRIKVLQDITSTETPTP